MTATTDLMHTVDRLRTEACARRSNPKDHDEGVTADIFDAVAAIENLTAERDWLHAGLNGIVNFQGGNGLTRAQMREAASDVLEKSHRAPYLVGDQTPFVVFTKAAEAERDEAQAEAKELSADICELNGNLQTAEANIHNLTAERDKARRSMQYFQDQNDLHGSIAEKALIRAENAERRVADMTAALKQMIHDYVLLLETSRDRIVAFGGNCESVDVMERDAPALRAARAALDGQQ